MRPANSHKRWRAGTLHQHDRAHCADCGQGEAQRCGQRFRQRLPVETVSELQKAPSACLSTVVEHENLPVLEGGHCSGVHVEIRVCSASVGPSSGLKMEAREPPAAAPSSSRAEGQMIGPRDADSPILMQDTR